MSYDNFKKDFVSRSLKNFEKRPTVKYEVTDLVNLCLGLIIMPDQFSTNNLVDIIKLESSQYGMLIKNKLISGKDKGGSVLHHMRNAIAHGHITQTKANKNGEIEELEFEDKTLNECNFKMRMTTEQLTLFAKDIAEAYCAQYEKEDSADK